VTLPNRFVGLGLVAVAFLTGVVAGVAGDRVFPASIAEGREAASEARRSASESRARSEAPRRAAPRMPVLREIPLSTEQQGRVDSILEYRRTQVTRMWEDQEAFFRAAMDSTESEILQVLTPDQRADYTRLLEEHRERRRQERREREELGPGPRR